MTTDNTAGVMQEDREAYISAEIAHPHYNGLIRLGKWDHSKTMQAFARHRLASVAAMEEEIKRLREALTPSGSTKAAYHGEFSFNLHRIDDCGDEYVEKVYVPWDTVKQIMKAILARTALEGRGS